MRKFHAFLTCSLLLVTFFQACIAQEYGKASIYSGRFQGGVTASGEKFNHADYMVSHRSHKLNARLRITRVDNGRSVVVRVVDRGPYINDCITDISKATAAKLGINDDNGTYSIKIEVINDPNIPLGSLGYAEKPIKKKDEPVIKVVNARPKSVPMPDPMHTPQYSNTKSVEKREVPRDYRFTPKSGDTNAEKKNLESHPAITSLAKDSGKSAKVLTINHKNNLKSGFAIQVASMGQYESMMREVARLQDAHFRNILVTTKKTNKGISEYKIMLGPFSNHDEAETYLKNMRKKSLNGFIIDLKSMR